MTDTEHLYKQSDDAANELTKFDRHVAIAKETVRAALDAALTRLAAETGIVDGKGRCFSALLEAIDDVVFDARKAISTRLEEADIAIEDAERVS